MREPCPSRTALLAVLASWLLAGGGCQSGTRRALEQLQSDDPSVRRAAVAALEETADAEAVAGLAGALEADPDEALRKEAARALEAIGDRRAVPALLAKAASRDTLEVRFAAASALGVLRDPESVRGLIAIWGREDDQADGVVNLEVVSSVIAVGPPAVPALLEALGSESWNVRYYAVTALGRIGAKEARSAIEARRNDPNGMVRAGVETALERLK